MSDAPQESSTLRESRSLEEGETTAILQNNNLNAAGHHKISSWGSGVARFAQDIFGGKPPLPPPPRPPPPRRSSSEEEEYHKRNQMFLQQAAAVGLHAGRAAAVSGAPNKQPFASPSPNTKFRKSLQLKAIEEDNQSFVVKSLATGQQQAADSSVVMVESEDHLLQNKSIRCHEGELADDMSSLGGDYLYCNSRGGTPQGGTPPYSMKFAANNTNTYSFYAQPETQFEQDQELRFQQQKQGMERKLAEALQQNSITKESDRTAFIHSYMQELERDRAVLLAQWKQELKQEEERLRQEHSRHRLAQDCYEAFLQPCWDALASFLASLEVILSNMPLTIGAVGLSWVTQGVVWFKFTEEMVDACQHVHYFSDQCTFREFPGCFQCDPTNGYYRLALSFHWLCSGVAALACVLFLLKVILAPQTVWDMLKNPATSTPAGVFCIAMVCTFAGQHGLLGETIVLVMSCFHVLLAFWFFYMAVFEFRLLPDPGWFPNLVGISYAAVKTWIYFPGPGLFLMTLCIVFFLGTFFISVVRVALNNKIAAPVCWIQLSAPSITLYAMTLVSQPTPQEELSLEYSTQEKETFRQFLETYYLPSQHLFMLLTMVGLVSAVHSLYVRWPTFKTKPFSPAHVAFCFPTLSHTNAIQAYRASLNALSPLPPGSLFKKFLFGYWCFFLFSGTILNLVFTIKYVLRIPEWTKPELSEDAPPAPLDTIVHEMMDETGAHEIMRQPFVSPAVLEASEAGVLVRVKRGTAAYRRHGPFVRTRNITSVGFDLMLSELEMREERARLLDWVANNAPRKRNRTLSVPGVMHLRNKNDGGDVYGTFGNLSQAETLVRGHARSKTTAGTPFV